jgi:hypothetical protein
MKKILMFASFVALAGALSSCLSTGLVSFTDITFESNYSAVINGKSQSVVCDDRQTLITYSFNVSGVRYLKYWETRFFGETTGSSFNLPNYTTADYVASGDRVTVTTNLDAGKAPRSSGTLRTVQPRAVIVVPTPTVLGATDIRLTIHDTDGGAVSGNLSSFRSDGKIPVVSNCPLN